MSHDSRDMLSRNNEEPGTAQQSILDGSLSSLSSAGESPLRTLGVSELIEQCQRKIQTLCRRELSNEVYGLELLRRARARGNQAARAGVQQCFGELVRGWLHRHPSRKVAAHLNSEESYVALAFERFWQATVQQQVAFRTLAGALAYLRASLNGALLDTLRAYAQPREVPLPEPGELSVEDRSASFELWEILERMLLGERERRLAYLLYHCNLKPREIVRFCQEEGLDIQEVYRLHRTILERFLRQSDQLPWQFSLQEQV